MSLSKRIQELRKNAGHSQEELAELLEVSRQALSKWENGQANPDVNNVIKLSKIYDKSTDYILLGEESEPQVIYQERIIYEKEGGLQRLQNLPRSFRIALSICLIAITTGVIVPVLLILLLSLF